MGMLLRSRDADRSHVSLLARRAGVGRFAVPVWALGVAVAVIGLAAGQAVGPVLSGWTGGSVSLTVS